MATTIIPYTADLVPAVKEFNGRMSAGGSKWGFYEDPVPDWLPTKESAGSWREYYLAVDDSEAEKVVRGGFALKPQQWWINNQIEMVTDWQGPFTEAAVDTRYSPLMLKLFRWMLKGHPLLFSLGHGGTEEPIVDLLRKMKWDLHGVSFCFRVLRPYRFLRFNRYLRSTPLRRTGLDLLAASGVGVLGIRLLQLINQIAAGRAREDASAEAVDTFGPWADDLWEQNKHEYRCLAVRDANMMNTLMPSEGWPGGTRLKMSRNGEVIGWAIVHHKRMTDDPRFGSLNVGLITDCFGSLAESTAILSAADEYLRSQDLDLIFANLSHPQWKRATRQSGYLVLEDKRMFAMSPALRAKLEPFDEVMTGLHLTNMDGHGPHGFQ